MSTDPAMVAVEKIIGAFPALRGQMLHGMPTIIRDAYAETWAAKDAEIERLTKQVEELRREVVCQSCGCNIICGSRNPDDFLCRGCGKVVCQTCVDVFEHLYDREHGEGDPCERLEELRLDAERYRWLRNSSWEVRRYYHTMLQSASVGNLDEAIDAALKETT